MKKSIFLAAAAFAAIIFGCRSRGGAPAGQLRPGDLVFVAIPLDYVPEGGSMAEAITASTGSDEMNIIHVAIADVADDGVYIIDATLAHGVDRHPLDTFKADFTLKDGSLPTFIIKRLKEPESAPDCIQKAVSFCGQPYDTAFLKDNGAMYCSELVRESYLTAAGAYLFDEKPMNWKDSEGNIPEYWTFLFGLLGMDVPQGEPGTNPADMMDSPLLETVDITL